MNPMKIAMTSPATWAFQGVRELRAARGKTTLIVVTVAMLTLMVTFLGALSGGLGQRSIGALEQELEANAGQALVLSATANGSLGASQLDEQTQAVVREHGGHVVFFSRSRVDDQPVMLMAGLEAPELSDGSSVYLEHLPVQRVGLDELAANPAVLSFGIVPDTAPAIVNTDSFTGKSALLTSASFAGENTSLSLMTNLLYIISALVLGAFFTVWTMQRLRAVTISVALGASRPTIVFDAISQALIVLLSGVGLGVLATLGGAALLGAVASNVPILLQASSIALPAAVLLGAGLLGAIASMRPILNVDPRVALNA